MKRGALAALVYLAMDLLAALKRTLNGQGHKNTFY